MAAKAYWAVHTVAVKIDLNAGANGVARTDGRGGAKDNYQPVAGLGTASCLIAFQKSRSILDHDRTGGLSFWKVMFSPPVSVNMLNLIVWVDPANNKTRYLIPDSESWSSPFAFNPSMDPFSTVNCVEYSM